MSIKDLLPRLPPLDITVQPADKNQGPPKAYKNDTMPRGAVFIANYYHFPPASDKKDYTRRGSEKDVINLENLFNQMGYKIVKVLKDGTLEQTYNGLTSFRDEDIHEQVDSLIVIFMSHGSKDDFFTTSDGKAMKCDDVIDFFSNSACPALHKKPKIFIFQMCRGINEHIKWDAKKPKLSIFQMCRGKNEHIKWDAQTEAATIPRKPRRKLKAARQISDVFVCYSSLKGFVSYRNDHGSYFVHYVCKIFMEHAKDKSLNRLMKMINGDVPEAVACETREMATIRKFYFNPSDEWKPNDQKAKNRTKYNMGITEDQCGFVAHAKAEGFVGQGGSDSGIVLQSEFDSSIVTQRGFDSGIVTQGGFDSGIVRFESGIVKQSGFDYGLVTQGGFDSGIVTQGGFDSGIVTQSGFDSGLGTPFSNFINPFMKQKTSEPTHTSTYSNPSNERESRPKSTTSTDTNRIIEVNPRFSDGGCSPIFANHKSQGIIMIINNLSSCCEDVVKLKNAFSSLGYEVQGPFSDLMRDQMLEKIKEFRSVNTRSVFIIIYGDGFEECLVSYDKRVITYKELFGAINDKNCPNLTGVPKLFIFNTCFYDGELVEEIDESGEVIEEDDESKAIIEEGCESVERLDITEDVNKDNIEKYKQQTEVQETSKWSTDGPGATNKKVEVPAERDIMIFSVEVDGHCNKGSRFTDALCNVLLSDDKFKDIEDMMRIVFQRMMELQDNDEEQYYTETRSINFKQDFYITSRDNKPSSSTTIEESQIPIVRDSYSTSRSSIKDKNIDILKSSDPLPGPSIESTCIPLFHELLSVKEVDDPKIGPGIYKNKSLPRGIVLIISVQLFGKKEDESVMLKEIFNQCGYKVIVREMLVNEDVEDLLKEFKKEVIDGTVDSTIIVVLGLAIDKNTFMWYDDDLPLQKIYKHFTNTSCPALKGKPKLFLFHMIFTETEPNVEPLVMNDLEDVYVWRLCSTADKWMKEIPTRGIKTLCRKLAENAHDTHIESITMQMNVALNIDEKNNDEIFHGHGIKFNKKFYFNPKMYKISDSIHTDPSIPQKLATK